MLVIHKRKIQEESTGNKESCVEELDTWIVNYRSKDEVN